ncbi:MAG: 30S ribosome-binding factor RbfA [Chloroflexi bacterium]|nr:30S ribosome-binding factor RbfA [Chloroflexota bacterium]
MGTIRQERVSELLFEELSILISNELEDPRLSLLSVTNLDVSRDLRTVKVYVTHSDENVSRRSVLTGLKNASAYMRRQIAERCGLRVVPELIFYYDESPERAARVEELLRRIAAEREERAVSLGVDGESTPGDVLSWQVEPVETLSKGDSPEQPEESGA